MRRVCIVAGVVYLMGTVLLRNAIAGPQLSLDPKSLPGVIVDDTQAEVTGTWSHSTHVAPYIGEGYLHDENKDKGTKTARYTAELPKSGNYQVSVSYTTGATRASNVPIKITTADGEQSLTLNQRRPLSKENPFMSLGVFRFSADKKAVLEISNTETNGHVIADAVQFLPAAEDVALGPNKLAGEPLADALKTNKSVLPEIKPSGVTKKDATKKDPLQVASVIPSSEIKPPTTEAHVPKHPVKKITSADLDALLDKELKGQPQAELTSDEQFLRRVTLDLIGRQPTAGELSAFIAEKAADKRSQTIDRLLSSDDFGRNWANYWSDVISHRVQPPELTFMTYTPLKEWLAKELNAGTPWHTIVTNMLTATGTVKDNPAATFVAYHQSNAVNLAGETTRIFLSIQIHCAECHDHPFDNWKQVQFHQMAAFFARGKTKMPQNESLGAQLLENDKGEQKNPKTGKVMEPVVLTGDIVVPGVSDAERRAALAHWVTHPDNPWFDKAFTNRVWARLMGRGFCEPVDNIGELQEHLLGDVHQAVADHFTATENDIKDLYRLILNSRAYQRQLPSQDEMKKIQFAAAKTAKLRGDEVFASLTTAIDLPNFTPPKMAATGAVRFPPPPKSTRDLVVDAFDFDPSFPPEMISRTMAQAMWLMNNQQLQAQINAKPDSGTLLAKLLTSESDDRAVIAKLFERVLARKPSEKESEIALEHVTQIKDRGAAFEDVLWSLVNGTEFTTKP